MTTVVGVLCPLVLVGLAVVVSIVLVAQFGKKADEKKDPPAP